MHKKDRKTVLIGVDSPELHRSASRAPINPSAMSNDHLVSCISNSTLKFSQTQTWDNKTEKKPLTRQNAESMRRVRLEMEENGGRRSTSVRGTRGVRTEIFTPCVISIERIYRSPVERCNSSVLIIPCPRSFGLGGQYWSPSGIAERSRVQVLLAYTNSSDAGAVVRLYAIEGQTAVDVNRPDSFLSFLAEGPNTRSISPEPQQVPGSQPAWMAPPEDDVYRSSVEKSENEQPIAKWDLRQTSPVLDQLHESSLVIQCVVVLTPPITGIAPSYVLLGTHGCIQVLDMEHSSEEILCSQQNRSTIHSAIRYRITHPLLAKTVAVTAFSFLSETEVAFLLSNGEVGVVETGPWGTEPEEWTVAISAVHKDDDDDRGQGEIDDQDDETRRTLHDSPSIPANWLDVHRRTRTLLYSHKGILVGVQHRPLNSSLQHGHRQIDIDEDVGVEEAFHFALCEGELTFPSPVSESFPKGLPIVHHVMLEHTACFAPTFLLTNGCDRLWQLDLNACCRGVESIGTFPWMLGPNRSPANLVDMTQRTHVDGSDVFLLFPTEVLVARFRVGVEVLHHDFETDLYVVPLPVSLLPWAGQLNRLSCCLLADQCSMAANGMGRISIVDRVGGSMMDAQFVPLESVVVSAQRALDGDAWEGSSLGDRTWATKLQCNSNEQGVLLRKFLTKELSEVMEQVAGFTTHTYSTTHLDHAHGSMMRQNSVSRYGTVNVSSSLTAANDAHRSPCFENIQSVGRRLMELISLVRSAMLESTSGTLLQQYMVAFRLVYKRVRVIEALILSAQGISNVIESFMAVHLQRLVSELEINAEQQERMILQRMSDLYTIPRDHVEYVLSCKSTDSSLTEHSSQDVPLSCAAVLLQHAAQHNRVDANLTSDSTRNILDWCTFPLSEFVHTSRSNFLTQRSLDKTSDLYEEVNRFVTSTSTFSSDETIATPCALLLLYTALYASNHGKEVNASSTFDISVLATRLQMGSDITTMAQFLYDLDHRPLNAVGAVRRLNISKYLHAASHALSSEIQVQLNRTVFHIMFRYPQLQPHAVPYQLSCFHDLRRHVCTWARIMICRVMAQSLPYVEWCDRAARQTSQHMISGSVENEASVPYPFESPEILTDILGLQEDYIRHFLLRIFCKQDGCRRRLLFALCSVVMPRDCDQKLVIECYREQNDALSAVLFFCSRSKYKEAYALCMNSQHETYELGAIANVLKNEHLA